MRRGVSTTSPILARMIASRLTTFVLVAVLCAIVAYWAMVLRAPTPQIVPTPPPAAPRAAFDPTLHARLFGGGVAGAQLANVRVVGVIAPGPTHAGGVAILGIDGKPPRAFAAGQTLDSGVRIASVAADRVVLDQHGAMVELAVPHARAGVGTMNPTGGAALPTPATNNAAGTARVLSSGTPQYQAVPQFQTPAQVPAQDGSGSPEDARR